MGPVAQTDFLMSNGADAGGGAGDRPVPRYNLPMNFSRRRVLKYALGLMLVGGIVVLAVAGWFYSQREMRRMRGIGPFVNEPETHPDWIVEGGSRCGTAPMIIPSTGYIGVGYRDGTPPMYAHTGYDIFSPAGADNVTPIYAAYDGYLTREANWRSAVIIRHPEFPELVDGEQIWTYYTHMASRDGEISYIDPAFPQGTYELFVEQGTLLGYQGTWSGDPARYMTLHLHFSIVKSTGPDTYANETKSQNTYDPLPFLGLVEREDGVIVCAAE
ncbi:MAG: M23 family metallopeptidase [Anaerolineales bacterium]|nr:M23 family metallopeptidase [Anaerolineales bacterium]